MYDETQRAKIRDHVLEELSKGRSLSSICDEDEGVCSYATWMRWELADEELCESVARAREAGATKLLEEIIDIADDKSEDANSRKVRIYAREKYAAMIAPRRFGQRLDVTSGGERLPSPVQADHTKIDALLALAMQRRAGLLEAPLVEGEVIELRAEPTLDELMS